MRLGPPLLVVLSLLAAAPALAAPSGASANASAGQALFEDAYRLKQAEQWSEALDKFHRSHELLPSVGALLNIGECYEKLDRPASAWGAYHEAENLAVRLKDSREGVARARAAALKPRLAHLTLTAPRIEGLVVTRGGEKVDPAIFDAELPIDHGRYVFEASAPGRKTWSATIEIAPGGASKLVIPELEVLPAATGPTAPVSESATSLQRTVGIGLEIGGGALLAAGLVFGGLTMGSWSSAEERCPAGKCPSEADRDASRAAADRASAFGAVSTWTIIAGAVALGGGLALHLTAPAKTSVALAPAIGPGFSGLAIGVRR